MAHAGTPASRLSRETKEPRRFADEEKYTTEQPPSTLRWMLSRRAEREQADDDDSAQPGAITGEEFVAREKKAAEAAGLSPQREKAPIHNRDARPKKVTLPRGWKPSSPQEVEDYLKHLNSDQLNKIVRLHGYAFFSGLGRMKTLGQATAKKWFLDRGLVVGPWHKEDFPGMCYSEELARRANLERLQKQREKQHDDAVFERLETMGLPKDEQTHDASYQAHVGDDLLVEAFNRGEAMPAGKDRPKKVKEWLPPTVATCIDCRRRRKLVRVEHAKGGPDDGKRREPPCPEDNKGERASCDVAIHAAYEEGETLTEDGYADILAVRLAYAHRPGASAEDKMLLAMGRRAAAEATVLEDREALSYGSSLRGRRVCNDLGPTLEQAREKFRREEAERLAARRQQETAAAARLAALPAVRCGTRVVVVDPDDGRDPRPAVQATMGARGVVRTRGTGWFHVELDGASGTTTGYRRAELAIDKSRKPAARKPAARKPAAKKRKAAEPARKPASKKKKSRK